MEPLADLRQFASAFIIKPSSLGDIVHTLPAVNAIKRAFPHLAMRWLCNTEWMPLLQGSPDLTEVIEFPRRQFHGLSALPSLLQWSRGLNAQERALPEIALDFQGLMRSALLGVARGAEPLIGLSDAREGAGNLYRHVVSVDRDAHAVDRYLELPRALGAPVSDLRFPLPEGHAPKDVELPADFIVLHPYSRGAGKSLRHEVIQSLCDCLAPHHVVLVGRCADAEPVTGHHVLSLVNRTDLLELIWLIRQARGVVSVDSGPMHIASAIAHRCLGIHTWSNPRKVGPYLPSSLVWKAGRIAARTDFSDAEVQTTQAFDMSDARRMADYLLGEWF